MNSFIGLQFLFKDFYFRKKNKKTLYEMKYEISMIAGWTSNYFVAFYAR